MQITTRQKRASALFIAGALILSINACSEKENATQHEPITQQLSTNSPEPDTSPSATPQSETDASAITSPSAINNEKDIKKEYAFLMDQTQKGKLTQTSFEYSCHGEKSGTVRYFSEGGTLKLIEHEHSEYSHHSGKDKYFLRDSKPFFVLFDRVSWSFSGSNNGESQTKDDITEQRFYIVEGNTTKCLEKKFSTYSAKENNPGSADVPNKEVQCPALSSTLGTFRTLQSIYENDRVQSKINCLEEQT